MDFIFCMDMAVRWLFWSLFFAFALDSGRLQAAGIIDTVVCRADASQSYALYVPDACGKKGCPVVCCFDPHGDGGHPLRLYKALADRYGFILAGSNNSKNGNDWGTTDRIWKAMSEDIRGRVNGDARRQYVCGFSGGAKVAGYIAIQYPGIRGVIAGGAGLPEGVSPGDFAFSLTMLTGEGDMNMTDLVALHTALDRTHTRQRLLLFDGIHEWAPPAVMDLAFAGLVLDEMRAGLVRSDAAFVAAVGAKSRQRAEALDAAGNVVRAEQECVFADAILGGLSGDKGWFRNKVAGYGASAAFKRQLQDRQHLLEAEQAQKNVFMQQFQGGDDRYWSQAVAGLRVKARAGGAEGGMNQRLLAFLSLAFYSLSNRCIQANDNVTGRHFVSLYCLADPTNAEAWYFSALLDAREGRRAAVDGDLAKAVGAGFGDLRRVRQQPEFQHLTPAVDLGALERAMHVMRKKTN